MNGLKLKGIARPKQTGQLHPNWKGANVGYGALHDWIKRVLLKPLQCPDCGEIKPLQVANLDNKYSRDLNTWGYKCTSCHRKYDYAMKGMFKGSKEACVNGHEYSIENKKFRKDGSIYCRECNKIRAKYNRRYYELQRRD